MISPNELKCLPLTHGSLLLDGHWEEISKQGLVAFSGSKKGVNTFNFDFAMGRHEYVFLSTARRHGYGMGNMVVIHPSLLVESECTCFLNDPGEAGGMFDQLRWCWQMGRTNFNQSLESIRDYSLAKFVADLEAGLDAKDDLEWELALKQEIYDSVRIREFYAQQMVSIEELFTLIAAECNLRNYEVKDYVFRSHTEWPYSEELLFHHKISAEFILGMVNEKKWIPSDSARPFRNIESFLKLLEVIE